VRHPARERPVDTAPTFSHAHDGAGETVAVGGEDYGTVLLRFESGARGTFTVSQVSAGRKNGLTLHIDAADMGFAWNQERPDRAWIGRRRAPNLELLRDPEVLEPRAAAMDELPAGHPAGWRDALHGLMLDFYGAVRADGPRETTFASFAEAHRSALVVEAILRSDREQAWTAVDRQEVAS
jgi:predicted dehydrogenase